MQQRRDDRVRVGVRERGQACGLQTMLLVHLPRQCLVRPWNGGRRTYKLTDLCGCNLSQLEAPNDKEEDKTEDIRSPMLMRNFINEHFGVNEYHRTH